MRQTPTWAVVACLLLGISGCAGVPQRLDWSTPATSEAGAKEAPAPNRFAWWRRPATEKSATITTNDMIRASEARAATDSAVPGDVWPDSRSEWLARRFPLFGRHGGANPAASDPDSRPYDRSDGERVSSRPRRPAAAKTNRADNDVRTVDTSDDDDEHAPGTRAHAMIERDRDQPAGERTASSVAPGRRERSVPLGDVELDVSNTEPAREKGARPEEPGFLVSEWHPPSVLAVDSNAVSPDTADHRPAPAPLAETPTETPLALAAAPQDGPDASETLSQAPRETDRMPPVPSIDPPSALLPAPASGAADQEQVAARPDPPANPKVAEAENAKPEEAAPKVAEAENAKPEAAAPKLAEAETAKPVEAAPKLADAEEPKPEEAAEADKPPVEIAAAEKPRPASTAGRMPSGPQRLSSRGRSSVYASPPPMAPPQPRRSLLAMLFAQDPAERDAIPQLPQVTFPTAYYAPGVNPSPAPRDPAVVATVATGPARKPGVLTAWLQKLAGQSPAPVNTAHHHHVGSAPCCRGCTCHVVAAGNSSARSPKMSLAARQGKPAPASSEPDAKSLPTGSGGTNPGDVAEEWKLFERVSFEGFDKTPQR